MIADSMIRKHFLFLIYQFVLSASAQESCCAHNYRLVRGSIKALKKRVEIVVCAEEMKSFVVDEMFTRILLPVLLSLLCLDILHHSYYAEQRAAEKRRMEEGKKVLKLFFTSKVVKTTELCCWNLPSRLQWNPEKKNV